MGYHRDAKDWIGVRIGDQTVIEKIGEGTYTLSSKKKGTDKKYSYTYITDKLLIKCDCGRERKTSAKVLLTNRIRECRFCARSQKEYIGDTCKTLVCIGKRWGRDVLGKSRIKLICKCVDCENIHEVKPYSFVRENTSCPKCRRSWVHSEPIFRKIEKKICDYFKECKRGAARRKLDFLVTLQQISNLIEIQYYKCALTNLDIQIGDRSASLDRIDSQKGYIIDNIQWVHKTVNCMKNELSQFEFVRFCKLVASNSQK